MKKVLILESNEAFARELSEYFAREGYTVCGVTGDGAQGLSLIEKNVPCVVAPAYCSLHWTDLPSWSAQRRLG